MRGDSMAFRTAGALVAIGEKSILRTKVRLVSYPLRAVDAPRLAACARVSVPFIDGRSQNGRYLEGCL
jgi:hypothetical protein